MAFGLALTNLEEHLVRERQSVDTRGDLVRDRVRVRVRVRIRARVRASPKPKPDQGLHARGKVDVVDAHALSELDLALGDVEHALLEEGGDEALGEVGVASRPLRDSGGERVLDLRGGVNREQVSARARVRG